MSQKVQSKQRLNHKKSKEKQIFYKNKKKTISKNMSSTLQNQKSSQKSKKINNPMKSK